MAEEIQQIETYDIIDDLNSDDQQYSEPTEGGSPTLTSDFDLSSFVAKEIGAKDNKILTGSPDDPIEYELSQLTPKQQIAILKDYYSRQAQPQQVESEFTDDEMLVINTLREGKLEDLYSQLGQELGVQQSTPPQLNQDQLIEWKIKSEIPEISQEELEYEIENFKSSPLYEKRMEGLQNQYEQVLQAQVSQQEQLQMQEQQAQMEQLQSQIVDIARSTEDIFDFEIDDDLREAALGDLLEPSEETGNPVLIDFLGTPEGLAQTAMLWRAMPEINNYVNSLHQEIDRLKSNKGTETNNKTVINQSDVNMQFEDDFDNVPELKPI